MSRQAVEITLSTEERKELERVSRSRAASLRGIERARIILLAVEGRTNDGIAQETGLCRPTVALWRGRFAREGVKGLRDRPGRGRRPTYTEAERARVIATVCT